MAQIDNLVLEISADSTKAIGALNNLSTSLSNLKKNLPTKKRLEETAQGFKALTDQISKLSLSAKNLDKIKAISTIARNLAKLNSVSPSRLKSTAENLDSLQGAMSHISYQAVEKIERLASAFSKLGEANKNMGSLKNVQKTANLSAQANPISTTPAESGVSSKEVVEGFGNVSEEAKEATENVGGFWTKFQTVQSLIKSNPISLLANSESADKMASLAKNAGMSVGVLTSLSKVLGWVGIALSVASVATKIFTGAIKLIISPIKKFIQGITTLVKALARIALYRAIRGVLKSITQGLKEGIQNLALYSKAMEELDAHSANNVMSRYASEFLYFKNAVATAVIPILRALIPYVETAINTLIKFINVLAQVGSAVFGTQYTKAKYFWVDYADSLDNASGSAKKLHHQLAGFDELNNLTDTQGGGGASKLEDASKMFEEALIDPKIKSFVDEVIGRIKNGFSTIKTAMQPFVDKIKEVGREIKERVLPNLKKIWEHIKTIWDEGLKPIVEGFLKGFFENYDNEFLNYLPDELERVSIFIEKITGFLAKLAQKIPNDKLETFGEKIGKITAKLVYILDPFNAIIFVCEKLVEWGKKIYDKFLDLQNPATILSQLIETLKDKINKLTEKGILLGRAFGAIREYFKRTNPFKDVTENSLTFASVLDYIKGIIDWLKTTTSIILDFSIKVTGWEKIQDIKDFLGLNITTGKDTNANQAQLPTKNLSKLGSHAKTRATGGFVNRGDLFIANEKTPEMIGSINGNTAVANNNQITEAIAQATYESMSRALSENNGSVTFVVEGDADKMFRVFQKKQKEYGKQTGLAY